MKRSDKMLLFWATACGGLAASAWVSSPPRARTVFPLFSSSSMENQPFDASAYERYSPPRQFNDNNDRSSKFDPATGLYEKGSQDPALGRELQPPMPLEPQQSLFNTGRNGPQQQDRNGMMPGNNFNSQQPNGNGRFGDMMKQDGRPNEFDNNNGFNNAPNEFMNNGFDARNGPPPGQFNNNQPPGQFMGNEPPPGQFYGGNPGIFGPRQQGPPPPGSRQQPFNNNDPQQQRRRNNGMPGDFNDNNEPPNDGRFGDRFSNNGFDDNGPNQPGRNGYNSMNDGFDARNRQEPPGPFNHNNNSNQPPGQFMRNEPPPGQFDGGPRSQGPPPPHGSQQPFFNGQQQNGMPGNNFDNNNRFGADMQQNGQQNDGRFGDMQNEFNNGFGGYGNDGEFGDDDFSNNRYQQQSNQFGQGQAQARPPTSSWDQQDNLNGRSNNDNSQLAANNRKKNNVYMNRDKPYYMQDDQRYDFGDRRRQSSLTNNDSRLKNGKPLSSLDMLEQLWEGTNRMFDSLGITSSLGSSSNNNKRGGSSQLFSDLFASFPKMIRTSFSQMEMQPLLDTAQRYLNEDVACTTALGGNIELGNVFSQAQATSSIDGQTKQIRTNLQVSVKGSNAAGTVNVYATEQGIEGMVLQLGGQGEEYSREINVQVPKGAGFGSGAYGGGFGNNNNNMMNNGGGGFGGNNGNWGMNTNMGANVVDVEVIPEEERQRQAQMATQQQEPRSLPFPKDWTTPV